MHLVFPCEERTTTLLEPSDEMLNAGNGMPRLLDIDRERFIPRPVSRATGPLQIAHGDIARACGYCESLAYYQKPSRVWAKVEEDQAFRWLLRTQGEPDAGMEDHTFHADLIFQSDRESFEPISHFREIMRDYPDTILLLNPREREDWIRSRLKHGHGDFLRRVMRQRKMASSEEVAAMWRQDWDAHLAEVREFMADRPQQLVEFNLDNDSVENLAAALPAYGLKAADWADVGRTRGVQRHPFVSKLKRAWTHVRWRPQN